MIKEALKRETFEKAFVLSKLSERMPDNQMKAVLGGYGGYDECCWCSWIVIWLGGSHAGSGTVCGNYGAGNCDSGEEKLRERLIDMLNGEDGSIFIVCNP